MHSVYGDCPVCIHVLSKEGAVSVEPDYSLARPSVFLKNACIGSRRTFTVQKEFFFSDFHSLLSSYANK
jgi:hypothetical protein